MTSNTGQPGYDFHMQARNIQELEAHVARLTQTLDDFQQQIKDARHQATQADQRHQEEIAELQRVHQQQLATIIQSGPPELSYHGPPNKQQETHT